MTQTMEKDVFQLMEEGKPYKSYKKTILAKIYLNVIDPFTGKPAGLIVEGNPHGDTAEDCIVDVWDTKADSYLKTANKIQFQKGNIIEYTRKKKTKEERSFNDVTDEELREIVHMKYFAFQPRVNKFTEVAPVFRLLEMAKEEEASDKYIEYITSKLSELQSEEFPVTKEEE